MSSVVTYIIVIAVYFVAMLAIGVLVGRRVKSQSDYFIARDQLNAPVIGFSFSATQMSGSTYLGTVGTLRTVGYPFVPGALSSAAAPWFCYILLGDRMRKIGARLSSVTLGDVFEARYGKTAGIGAVVDHHSNVGIGTACLLACRNGGIDGLLDGIGCGIVTVDCGFIAYDVGGTLGHFVPLGQGRCRSISGGGCCGGSAYGFCFWRK